MNTSTPATMLESMNSQNAPTPLEALKILLDSFMHDGNGKTKGNQAKTDIIEHNEDVRVALNIARYAIDRAEAEQAAAIAKATA